MVVSSGRLVAVTDSFGWVTASAPISWKKCLSASAHSASSSQIGIGTTMRGSSWAMSAAALAGDQRATERDAGDVDRPDVAELLLGQQVADVAEVDRVHAVDLDDERDLLAGLGAAGVVAIGPDAGDQDLLDLVLTGTVEHERVIEAGREERAPVARLLALRSGERSIIGVAEGDDVAGDPAAGRPDDRLEWICHDDGVLAPEPDARPPIPREFHRPESDTTRCTGGYRARRASGVGGGRRAAVVSLSCLPGLPPAIQGFQPGCVGPTTHGPPAHGGLPGARIAVPLTVSTSSSVAPASALDPTIVTDLPT